MAPQPSPPVIITTDLDATTENVDSPAPITGTTSSTLSPPIIEHVLQDPLSSSLSSPLYPSSHLSPSRLHPPGRGHSPSPSWGSALTPPSPTLTNASSVHFSEDTPITPRASVTGRSGRQSPSDLRVVEAGDVPRRTHGWAPGIWDDHDHDDIVVEEGGGDDRSKRHSRGEVSSVKRLWWTMTGHDGDHGEDRGRKGKQTGEMEAARMSHIDPDKDQTDPTPFREKPSRLAMLVDPKSLEELEKIGGIDGLLEGLGVDGKKGLASGIYEGEHAEGGEDHGEGAQMRTGDGPQWISSMDDRRRVYGRNDLPERKSKSLLSLIWIAFRDKVIIILAVAAIVSLALGLYQDFGTPRKITYSDQCPQGCQEPAVDWVEGVAIMVAIFIVVMVGSINDWQKERQFSKLNAKREDRTVKVIRGGNEMVINVRDLVVGDIALVEPGEIIPVDGVFLRGHNVRCDESGATGESDAIKKASYKECIEERDRLGQVSSRDKRKLDCFMVSGAKVLEGVGEYVVTSVGQYSFHGRIMMAMRGDSEETPLQVKLNDLAELIAKVGGGAGLLLFVALMIRFFVQLGTEPDRSPNDKAQSFIQILIISVTLVVVAVPEGLPLAVTLALAFATKRMTKQNLLVRVLGSCETMGHATVVCTDKTGTLTQNVMTVVAGSLGGHGKFVRGLEENPMRSNANNIEGRRNDDDFAFDMTEINSVASPQLQELFNEAICINSTAFEGKDEDGNLQFVGSKTETALLRFAKELGWANWRETRDGAQVVQMIPFSSELKAMGVVVKRKEGYRLYLKGASEILTKDCSARVVVKREGGGKGIETTSINREEQENIAKTIIFYADQTLRTLALCYRDFPSWPPSGSGSSAEDEVPYNFLAKDLTLIAVTAIEDPLREGVKQAVADCQHAGVSIKMCTGDNVLTARSIASQCGIFTPGGIVMEGPIFRKLNNAERLEIAPRLQILARSSPEDKRLLVKTLKSMGEVVGVTGDGTNDGPALKLANVGFSMGIAGTEVAKEASDIILMDDSFANVVLAVMWGRCVNDSVKKFLQFQISVNITAVVITFVSAVASNSEQSVLSAVQLLWVNLIMDTFAALALATDPASKASLDRKPDRKNAPLITVEMLKMIIVQALYQIIVCLVLHFAGENILRLQSSTGNDADIRSLVFNCFVFCQIFNQLNCRRLDRKFNVLEGFFRNYWFMGIFLIMVGGQILIIEIGGAAFSVQRLYGRDWAISLIVGLISLPLGALIRLVPTKPIESFLVRMKLYPDVEALPTISPDIEDQDNCQSTMDQFAYNPALRRVKDNLHTYARIRGGRMRANSFVLRSRNNQLKHAHIQPSSLLAMVPTLVAGGVGAGAHWVAPAPGSEGRGRIGSISDDDNALGLTDSDSDDDGGEGLFGSELSRKEARGPGVEAGDEPSIATQSNVTPSSPHSSYSPLSPQSPRSPSSTTSRSRSGTVRSRTRSRSKSIAELVAESKGAFQVHPDTDPNDPLIKKFGIEPPSPKSQFEHQHQQQQEQEGSQQIHRLGTEEV